MHRLLHSFFVIYSYSLILYGLHLLSKLNFFYPFFVYLSCLVSALPISFRLFFHALQYFMKMVSVLMSQFSGERKDYRA